MSDFAEKQKGILGETISLRTAVLDMVSDDDLKTALGGKSLTLGELLLEQAKFQQSYINAFNIFKQDWSVKATEPEPLTINALKHLFANLDRTHLKSRFSFEKRNKESDFCNKRSKIRLIQCTQNSFEMGSSQLFTTLEQLTKEDLAKSIDRGGWDLSVESVLIAYQEAVLIFTAKESVYLKAMNKDLTGQLKSWIG